MDTRWSSASRCTSSSRRARRSSAAARRDFGAPPNTNTCPVCLALPGALPVLNERAVELAVRAALALGCAVQPALDLRAQELLLSRPAEGLPDLAVRPAARDRRIDLQIGDARRRCADRRSASRACTWRRTRASRLHDRFPAATAIDLNRAGVPLIEIVSEPDMRSAAEAGAYLRALKQILEYIDVSDVNMEEGSLRVDANVSARPARRDDARHEDRSEEHELVLGRRARARGRVRAAVSRARARWRASSSRRCSGTRTRARCVRRASKEGSHDYRYFPEPDLPPLDLDRAVDRRSRGSISRSCPRRDARASRRTIASAPTTSRC